MSGRHHVCQGQNNGPTMFIYSYVVHWSQYIEMPRVGLKIYAKL